MDGVKFHGYADIIGSDYIARYLAAPSCFGKGVNYSRTVEWNCSLSWADDGGRPSQRCGGKEWDGSQGKPAGERG